MDILLKELRWVTGSQTNQGDIRIRKGLISGIGWDLISQKNERVLHFGNHFIYPGLINSHDHLEMNLYPRLGRPPYKNYIEWGKDIYRPEESPIREIEKVDAKDRLLWGGIKNLISGVTTVIHHNPWHRFMASKDFPVKVLKDYKWAHSCAFGKNLAKSFPKKNSTPFIIHAAEGTDEVAHAEIQQLAAKSLIRSNTVLVHGTGVTDADIAFVEKARASMVWCPASNLFMFSQTAPVSKLKSRIKISLGTDSTLTGSPTLFDEMKTALKTGLVTPEEVYRLVTSNPATIFNLPPICIRNNAAADFFILPIQHSDYYENLIQSHSFQIELMFAKGNVALSSEGFAGLIGLKRNIIGLNGIRKWINSDILNLKRRIKKHAEMVLDDNPLWQLIQTD